MENVLYSYHFNFIDHLFSLIPIVIGIVFLAYTFRKDNSKWKGVEINTIWDTIVDVFFRIIGVLLGPLLIIVGVWAEFDFIKEHFDYKEMLKNEQVYVVEGIVEDFHPMPFSGHDMESFTINDVYFEYSDFNVMNGYHRSKSHGGVVKENGQHLRIKYIMSEDAGEEGVIDYIILYIADIGE